MENTRKPTHRRVRVVMGNRVGLVKVKGSRNIHTNMLDLRCRQSGILNPKPGTLSPCQAATAVLVMTMPCGTVRCRPKPPQQQHFASALNA